MTREEVELQQTQNGGYTRETLAKWGVPWPPPKGWKRELTGGVRDKKKLLTRPIPIRLGDCGDEQFEQDSASRYMDQLENQIAGMKGEIHAATDMGSRDTR